MDFKHNALVSVSDKQGIIELCNALLINKYRILATGKTAKLLLENGINCTEVSEFTGFPEIFEGRVKTLQPKIFGGILQRPDNEQDKLEALENGIELIDVVVVNLYPFPQVANRKDIDLETKVENIDIGGPSLIRAAAKNYKYVTVLTNPNQYNLFIEKLNKNEIDEDYRKKLAVDAFSHTSYYDTIIANYFEKEFNLSKSHIRINYPIYENLRYGENPHQKAAFYGSFNEYFEFLHGKDLSYNNIVDLNAAVELINDLPKISCAIIKHTNPCGAAISNDVFTAYTKALSTDPVSAFGGIVAFNDEVDLETAKKLNEIFLEIVVAPAFSADALEELKKKKNRRILKYIGAKKEDTIIKSVIGGLLVQDADNSVFKNLELKLVTENSCKEEQFKDIELAWVICKHVKSNAIVYVKDGMVLGVGAGQMSRVDSAKIAVMKAKEHNHNLEGAVAASDAFFPFSDGLEEIVKAGINVIIQPGGSIRDNEVIEAANKNKISMYFTSIRNFKH